MCWEAGIEVEEVTQTWNSSKIWESWRKQVMMCRAILVSDTNKKITASVKKLKGIECDGVSRREGKHVAGTPVSIGRALSPRGHWLELFLSRKLLGFLLPFHGPYSSLCQ